MKLAVLFGLGLLGAAVGLSAAYELEDRDEFCASCHTEPETTYYVRTLAAPTDLASGHASQSEAIRCIDCHSGQGAFGRLESMGQGFSDLLSFVTDDYQQPAKSLHPVGDEACTKCHVPPASSDVSDNGAIIGSKSHYHLLAYLETWATRSADARGTCSVCHIAHTEGLKESQLFIPQDRLNEACEGCHVLLSGWLPPNGNPGPQ